MEIVLVVEDEIETCKMLVRLLNRSGFTGECAFSGSQALAYLQRHVPDLVLLDFMMPDMDGLEVLRRIRRSEPTAQVPVVILSAIADPKLQDHARQLGATDYWVKASFDYSALQDKVAAVLASSGEAA